MVFKCFQVPKHVCFTIDRAARPVRGPVDLHYAKGGGLLTLPERALSQARVRGMLHLSRRYRKQIVKKKVNPSKYLWKIGPFVLIFLWGRYGFSFFRSGTSCESPLRLLVLQDPSPLKLGSVTAGFNRDVPWPSLVESCARASTGLLGIAEMVWRGGNKNHKLISVIHIRLVVYVLLTFWLSWRRKDMISTMEWLLAVPFFDSFWLLTELRRAPCSPSWCHISWDISREWTVKAGVV